MNKYKYLFKNIGLLTLSNFATKLLSFFLVPLYTAVLTTSQYGTYDLFNTTVSVLIPLFTLNILDAVLRFGMDNDYDKDMVVMVGIKWFTISCVLILFIIFINHFFVIFPILEKYKIYFFLMFFSQALSGIVTSYARGTDHVASLSVSSVIASIFTIGCNIIFLIPFKWGLPGYFIANIIGPTIQCIYLTIRLRIWKHIDFKKRIKKHEQQMLNYSMPLIANSISWWINNVSDRYIVTWFCGIAANGIYSVSTKIPTILNVFQTIFNQAWSLSAVKSFDSEDKDGFFSNTYKMYNAFLVLICSGLVFTDKILAKFLYLDRFYIAWRYVPFLTLAILFGSLSGYIGGFFTAVKDSKVYATSTIWGAVINIVLNFLLVPYMGAFGASIATAVAFFIVWGLRVIQSKKYIKLDNDWMRDIWAYIALILQSVILLCINNNLWLYGCQSLIVVFILILYRNELKKVMYKLVRKNIGN